MVIVVSFCGSSYMVEVWRTKLKRYDCAQIQTIGVLEDFMKLFFSLTPDLRSMFLSYRNYLINLQNNLLVWFL